MSELSVSNFTVSPVENSIPPKALIRPEKVPPVEATNPVKSTVSNVGSAPLLALKTFRY